MYENRDAAPSAAAATPTEDTHVRIVPVRGVRRLVYVAIGGFFVGLAVLGAILPVLPCTPFLLLASYFFVRSSPALHERLLQSRLFGQMLRDWHKHRAVRPRVKFTALSIMPVAVISSAYFGDLSWPLVGLLCVLAFIGMFVVARLPVVDEDC